MEVSGSQQIAAPREVVWAALSDPAVLKLSIPGCESLTGDPEQGFLATVRQRVGPVGTSFSGRLTLTDADPPASCTILGEGQGGAAGLARGAAAVRLAEADGSTLLTYSVTARVDGKLAQVGARIVEGFARKLAAGFFDRFRVAIEPPSVAAEPHDIRQEPSWFGRLIGRKS